MSIFGSARTPRDHPRYEAARKLAHRLGEQGYAIITGGGPGIMEAANRGAQEAGAISVGLGIELPHEQSLNEYVDVGVTFHYFFTRKVMFVRYASGFVVFPGGFGTLDEAFEAATLRQTQKIRYFPIVLFDSALLGRAEGLAAGLGAGRREHLGGRRRLAGRDRRLRRLPSRAGRRRAPAAAAVAQGRLKDRAGGRPRIGRSPDVRSRARP